MKRALGNRHRRAGKEYRLLESGWAPEVRATLEGLIQRGAGQGLPVVFDFDNTIVCGDIGEATMAVLARNGLLRETASPEWVSPSFKVADGHRVALAGCADATEYYELFLTPTPHGANDPTPLANGYVWAVEAMQGLCLLDVIEATREAFRLAEPMQRRMIEVTPGRTAYPAPFFYPESVELIALLLRARFDVWIVSASNAWSVRWMVLNGLNPLLSERGVKRGLAPDRVVGVSTLLADDQQRLCKDTVLVREDPAYARLEEGTLAKLRLTSKLHFPVPTYAGKVACIWQFLGRAPFLCAGDSPGDHAMLSFSENRLWIARLEKPGYLKSTLRLRRGHPNGCWLFQPALTQGSPGFLSGQGLARERLGTVPESVRDSGRLLRACVAADAKMSGRMPAAAG